MITFEIILFILSLLFGILIYWRESKNNKLYRLANRLTHAKEQQMKPNNPKGFVYEQPFVMRLIYIVLLILATYLIAEFLTPIRILDIKYLTTIIVGTIVGTYLGSFVVTANQKLENSQEIIDETLKKGKNFIEDLTTEDKIETPKHEKPLDTTKKSARERLKDKGYMD